MRDRFEVVVVGGGHAGCEAALAAARLGCDTLLVTNDASTLARMSCNPAIGGLAKGQVVREIDALGGAMGVVADRTGIQFKVLNASRGPAVRGLRCQSDKAAYAAEMTRVVRETPNVTLAEAEVVGVECANGVLAGVVLKDGSRVHCGAAVFTSGTFLRGLIHVGGERAEAGRWGEPAASGFSDALRALGLRLGRMKTGTPPRVAGKSIDRSKTTRAPGDGRPTAFSLRSRWPRFPHLPQVDCWLTHTNERAHQAIRKNLHRSPLYSGAIAGRGPRYCPSIEDKVVRFAEKERHQIFIEPEGLATDWLYLNGLSMSLPPDVQAEVVHAIDGLEDAEILRPAYAVEYDVVFPEQLDDSLQVRALPGLFLAGQVNGTSGYEEAAGQGLLAGANAALRATGREPFLLKRHEAYIGVMVDDLATLGTDEPYRLLSSRAEYRLLLGADTAYARLVPKANAVGLLSDAETGALLEREARIERTKGELRHFALRPDRPTREQLGRLGLEIAEEKTLAGLVRRPDLSVEVLREILVFGKRGGLGAGATPALDEDELARVADDLRYEGYVAREEGALRRLGRSQETPIPAELEYKGLPGLSREAAEKLERHRPRTLGQASRIPGVPPAAITLLLARLSLGRKEAAPP